MSKKEGYLLIDNRESPGVSEGLIHQSGKDAPFVRAGQMFESATVSCSHCQRIVILNPDRTRPRGYCRKCDAYICDSPGCNAECNPFEKVIAEFIERANQNPLGV